MSTERIAKCSVTGAYSTDKMRELQMQLADGEVRDKVEHYEPFGFTSEPLTDGNTDSVIVFTDDSRGLGMVICVADRRYRPTDLTPGEVCVYDKKGRKVFFSEEGIFIEGVDDPITVNTTSKVIVNAPTVEVNSTDVTINATNVNINAQETTVSGHMTVKGGLNVSGGSGAAVSGNLSTTGTIHADQNIDSSSDVLAGSVSLKTHIHSGVQAGGANTGTPVS